MTTANQLAAMTAKRDAAVKDVVLLTEALRDIVAVADRDGGQMQEGESPYAAATRAGTAIVRRHHEYDAALSTLARLREVVGHLVRTIGTMSYADRHEKTVADALDAARSALDDAGTGG